MKKETVPSEYFSTPENKDSVPDGQWSYESTTGKALEAADVLEDRFVELGWTEEQLGQFKLAVHEAAVNAVLYGNENDPSKKFGIELNMTKDEHGEEMAEVTIWHEGKGFDPGKIPDPTEGDALMEGHGRGVFLMKMLSDAEPEFFTDEPKVILRLKKNRKPETDTIV
jgi:serine/threonine-protein kinase RsbW